MRSCYSRAGLGRIGLAVTAIGVGRAHLAAQTSSDCLPPALASQLNEVFAQLPTDLILEHDVVELSFAFTAMAVVLIGLAILLGQAWRPLP